MREEEGRANINARYCIITADPRLGPQSRTPPGLCVERGGAVGKASSTDSSPQFTEDFPGGTNAPVLTGVLVLRVRAQEHPVASEQALGRKWKTPRGHWQGQGSRPLQLWVKLGVD